MSVLKRYVVRIVCGDRALQVPNSEPGKDLTLEKIEPGSAVPTRQKWIIEGTEHASMERVGNELRVDARHDARVEFRSCLFRQQMFLVRARDAAKRWQAVAQVPPVRSELARWQTESTARGVMIFAEHAGARLGECVYLGSEDGGAVLRDYSAGEGPVWTLQVLDS